MTDYLQVAVNERGSPEGHRECANAINHCLDEITSLDERITLIEAILSILDQINNEEAIMVLTIPVSLPPGTIAPYQLSKSIDADALITENTVLGTITIGVTGWYNVTAYIQALGLNNNAYYSAFIDLNAGAATYLIGSIQWDQNNPGMGFNGTTVVPLTAGDVIKLTVLNSVGQVTVQEAQLSVSMTGL